MGTGEILVNELLAYVATYQSQSTQLQLKLAILAYYKEDEVDEAKRILVDATKDIVNGVNDAFKDRQNSNRRSAREANVEDILVIHRALDTTDEDQRPIFCARDVSKLPPVAPEAAGSMVSLFEIMSSQRRDIDALSKAVADLTADVEKNKSEISSAKPPM